MSLTSAPRRFLSTVHPYDGLSDDALAALADDCAEVEVAAGDVVYDIGDAVGNLFILQSGEVVITDDAGAEVALMGARDAFGERALLRNGVARRKATAVSNASLILIPARTFFSLIETHPRVARFFDRRRPVRDERRDLATLPVRRLMSDSPVTCAPDASIREAAELMRDRGASSVCVVDGPRLRGIVTLRDMNAKVVAAGADPAGPVTSVMTADPLTLSPGALGSDVLHTMVERGFGHLPIVEAGRLVGVVSQTDLTRVQALSSGDLVRRIFEAPDAAAMKGATAEIPKLLVQLVGAGARHDVVTRLITDIADAATRRLLSLAEAALGPPPAPYLWLACGSQGRREQTGVSDQDNCLILSDDADEGDDAYFAALAKFVSDGLDACGYFYCPGDMMATNPRWRRPLSAWRDYFAGWIARPDPEAQMLASVMFDMRPIGGDEALFADLREETLKNASANSIFTAHMIANSLKLQLPLGLLRGLATIRSGEHRDRVDMKLRGVAPVVDLGRAYALKGRLTPVNTRLRLEAAQGAGLLSPSGGADLLDAYDLIATMRLEHQATRIKAGETPDNFLDPSTLSDFERSHLRDAFVVVKMMQSAIGAGKGALG